MGDYFVGVVGVSKQEDSPYNRDLVKNLINAAEAVSLAENDVLTAINRDKTHRTHTANTPHTPRTLTAHTTHSHRHTHPRLTLSMTLLLLRF